MWSPKVWIAHSRMCYAVGSDHLLDEAVYGIICRNPLCPEPESKGRLRLTHNDGIERFGIADGVVETAMGATAILCTGLALSAYSEAIASFFSGKQVSTALEPSPALVLCGTGGSTCLCGPCYVLV